MPALTIISTLLPNMRPARSSIVSLATGEISPVDHLGDGTRAMDESSARLARDAIASAAKRDDSYMAISMQSTVSRPYLALMSLEGAILQGRAARANAHMPPRRDPPSPGGYFFFHAITPRRRGCYPGSKKSPTSQSAHLQIPGAAVGTPSPPPAAR